MSSAPFTSSISPSSRSTDVSWYRDIGISIPLALLAWLGAVCTLLPFVLPLPAPVGGDILASNLPLLSPGHLLGTDANGNDMLSRLIAGGRTSLGIAIAVNAIGLVLGTLIGAVCAWRGGYLDAVVMRMIDAMISIPALILVLAVAQSFSPSFGSVILALAFFSIPAFARLARAATMRTMVLPFILAAQLSGTRAISTLVHHVGPAIAPQVLTFALLGMGTVVTIEGAISFLGLGIPAPYPTWGNMIYQGQMSISVSPQLVLLPSMCLFLTVLGFNLLSEGVRVRWGAR